MQLMPCVCTRWCMNEFVWCSTCAVGAVSMIWVNEVCDLARGKWREKRVIFRCRGKSRWKVEWVIQTRMAKRRRESEYEDALVPSSALWYPCGIAVWPRTIIYGLSAVILRHFTLYSDADSCLLHHRTCVDLRANNRPAAACCARPHLETRLHVCRT